MIDTVISLGIMSILLFIALKAEIINEVTHEIRDILIGGNSPPPPSSESSDLHQGSVE